MLLEAVYTDSAYQCVVGLDNIAKDDFQTAAPVA